MNQKTIEKLDTDAIIQFLQSETLAIESLSKTQQELYDRAKTVKSLINKWGSRRKVIPDIIKLYGVTEEHAYKIYRDTQIIFGSISKNDKSFWVELLLERISEVYRLAKKDDSLKEMNAANKQLHAAIKDFFPETDAITPDDLNIPAIFMGFYPEELGMSLPTEIEIQKRVSRILEFKKKKQTEYTDFEEIEAQNSDD